jgi:hypothetical protein
MHAARAVVLLELDLQLDTDDHRQCAPLTPRVRVLARAQHAGERAQQRQALIELAAVCVAAAERLPAQRLADLRIKRARERVGLDQLGRPPSRRALALLPKPLA